MKTATIDFNKCDCEKCEVLKVCAKRAVVKLDDDPVFIDRGLCSGCRDCVPACPRSAITILEDC